MKLKNYNNDHFWQTFFYTKPMKLKDYTKALIPPALIYIYNGLRVYNFKRFWQKHSNNSSIEKDLKEITDLFINSESYNFVSNIWNYTNIKNFKQIIKDGGINNYANTVAKNYYYFAHFEEKEIQQTCEKIENDLINFKFNLFKKHEYINYSESIHYNTFVVLLYLNLKKRRIFEKLKDLSDRGYLSFNDPFIEVDNVNVTTDKINALFDYEKIDKFAKLQNIKSILEIGAGSGRTSQAIMTFNQNLRYIICDIPPAIFISYTRLKKTFPDKKIKFLFNYKNEKSLMDEINNNDISFIFPHQMKDIQNKSIDLTLAIDCIHEMDKKTIKYYFHQINKFSNLFYF
jgi:putative sugar O-methyltransferase